MKNLLNRFKTWILSKTRFWVVFSLVFMFLGIILFVVFVSKYFGGLLTLGFIIWLFYKHNTEDNMQMNEEQIYYDIHERLISVMPNIYTALGCSNLTPKMIACKPSDRIGFDISRQLTVYRYSFIVPDTFDISSENLKKFFNSELKSTYLYGAIPYVDRVVRRDYKIELAVILCSNICFFEQYMRNDLFSNQTNNMDIEEF